MLRFLIPTKITSRLYSFILKIGRYIFVIKSFSCMIMEKETVHECFDKYHLGQSG